MANRFNTNAKIRYGVKGVPSGYEGFSTDFHVPSSGIEDVDIAVFQLFETELPLITDTDEGLRKVPVVFAAGEKWALVKDGRPIRDNNGSLILPLITIARLEIAQSYDKDIAGRGSNQHTGEIQIIRKLDQRDRGYQNLVNRLLIHGQPNLGLTADDDTVDGQIITGRTVGDLASDPTIADGGYLMGDVRNNIHEIISFPTPQFMTIKYELTLWTQHMSQMNQLIEGMVSSYLPQTRGWKIRTSKGYWFIVNVMSDEFKFDGNQSDMARKERVIRHKLEIEVPMFILASNTPGAPIPVRKFVSAPTISFGMSDSQVQNESSANTVEEPFLGADDPTLPGSTSERRRDGRATNHDRVFPEKSTITENDPALSTRGRKQKKSLWRKITVADRNGVQSIRYARIKSYNKSTGEMIIVDNDLNLGGLSIVSVDD